MIYKLKASGQVVSLTERQFDLLSLREQSKFILSSVDEPTKGIPQGIIDSNKAVKLEIEQEIIAPPIVESKPKSEPLKVVIQNANDIDSLFK